ncbi:unnamed protein product [Tuber melanosporum]|uniref:(Perigord truffle) hypothetical protein n=1 Tax=Tuber melanosporum (strain Mel28) TaxID=656061 RepID=D5GEN6_TUBMM|nr:uncharacterized protein GSTUM_00001316001 [Tuber melanosporum]KAG0128050.1 acyl CoA binding protein-domain-containing protein [Tuber indicum]CAZ82979.1 unnamed protein product [Tuber melanosporum]
MSDSVDRVFAHALQTVRKIPKTGSARPPPEDRLKLYGLYKQSMEGNVNGVMERPSGYGNESKAERDKWDAWNSQAGLSKTEAKRQYITTLIETMHKYSSNTPEARELVSELEFVWEQIKSNVSSLSTPSSSTSPFAQHSSALLPMPSGSYPDFGGDSQHHLGLVSPNPFGEEEFDDEDTGMDTDRRSNRKWRRRVEQALAKMATEVAALREQLETARARERRGRLRNWVLWTIYVVGRHLVIEAVFWGLVFLWMRRKGDRVAQDALRLVIRFVRERLKFGSLRGKKGVKTAS